jgi:ABC-type glycerol-3-phosphate transport system permease component
LIPVPFSSVVFPCIVLTMIAPGIAAAAILCFLCAWNDIFFVSGLTAGAVKGQG